MALSGSEFDRLVDAHAATLYRMAYRMVGDRHEAEDLVQDTFRSAWTSRASFEPGRSDRAWLVSILRRRSADHWRRRRLPMIVGGGLPPEVRVEGDDPLHDRFTDAVQHALDALPGELRESLLLVVVGELTHREAARELGVPLGTVLSRVSRARARLRKLLLEVDRRTG
ncbi:MAG: sigma-70 family RNA polymerase sigma factor [Pirellulales bacterium]|nr:sigma-70 family RNA polymerase sigma factor [Pirellulales bacterium]